MSYASVKFEALVRRILEQNGFVVHEPSVGPQDLGFDFFARLFDEAWAIEVKYYRTARPQVNLIEAAALRLTARAQRYQAKKGMLVVSCFVPKDLRDSLEAKLSITLVDRNALLVWSAGLPELLDELNAILEVGAEYVDTPRVESADPRRSDRVLPTAPPPEDTRGSDLCQLLRTLQRGKKTWSAFEALSEQVLKYLFPNDLHGWHKQKSTDDGANRYDYVCRIRPTTEFWQFLVQHLDSRYVIFEFKNYSEKIKQGQVLTTEKYLLERGLRRVAIVFSRAGADTNALRMAQGAMREHGKLILVLDDDDVCKMLHMKERGEDPSDYLFEAADNFLLALPR